MAKIVSRRTVSPSVRNMLAAMDEDILQADAMIADELDETMTDDLDEITASEEVPGVEDTIEDTAEGGDATVQEVVPSAAPASAEVESDAAVFPTESSYVQANILTRRLDRIANELEAAGHKKLAFRVDKIADYIENRSK